jgi:hypothetical protein
MKRAGPLSLTCPLRQLQELAKRSFRIYPPNGLPRSGLRGCDGCHKLPLEYLIIFWTLRSRPEKNSTAKK